MRRSHDVCEACGQGASLDWAHLFQRRNIVREPLASSPQFTAGLDRDCHNHFDRGGDKSFRDELRWDGIDRLFAALHVELGGPLIFEDPIDAAHYIERWCAKQDLTDAEIMERCLG